MSHTELLIKRNTLQSEIGDIREEVEILMSQEHPPWHRIANLNLDRRAKSKELKEITANLDKMKRVSRPGVWSSYAIAFIDTAKARLSPDLYKEIDQSARDAIK